MHVQQRLGPFSAVRPLIFARSEKLQRGRVAFDYTQKSTAFMGKEAEPSVSRFVCAARIAFLRAGENGRTEKESESKNPIKLPKDSADPSSELDLPRPLLSIKLSRRGKERYSRGGILKRFVRFSSTGNRIEGGGEKAASSDSSSFLEPRRVNFSNHGENTLGTDERENREESDRYSSLLYRSRSSRGKHAEVTTRFFATSYFRVIYLFHGSGVPHWCRSPGYSGFHIFSPVHACIIIEAKLGSRQISGKLAIPNFQF